MLIKYFLAWFGMMMLAILNGGFRDFAYKAHVGDLAAHQLSTASLLLLFAVFFWGLFKIWPIQTKRQSWVVGGMWFLMTLVFEFGMGRLLMDKSWGELLYMYHLFDGQVWLFIPLWVLIGPYVFFRYIH